MNKIYLRSIYILDYYFTTDKERYIMFCIDNIISKNIHTYWFKEWEYTKPILDKVYKIVKEIENI